MSNLRRRIMGECLVDIPFYQLIDVRNSISGLQTKGTSIRHFDNDILSINSPNATANDNFVLMPFPTNHKYIFVADTKIDYDTESSIQNRVLWAYGTFISQSNVQASWVQTKNKWERNCIYVVPISLTEGFRIYSPFPALTRKDCTNYFKNVQIFDVTLMFGAGNEPNNHIEFLNWLDENHLTYVEKCEGTIIRTTQPSWIRVGGGKFINLINKLKSFFGIERRTLC